MRVSLKRSRDDATPDSNNSFKLSPMHNYLAFMYVAIARNAGFMELMQGARSLSFTTGNSRICTSVGHLSV